MMPSLFELAVALPLLTGTFFTVVTTVGLLRFPDVYCRMHAAGKAGTLGVSLMILAAVVWFAPTDASVAVRGVLAIGFQFITTPAAAHLLARGVYVAEYPKTHRTAIDELHVYFGEYVRERYGKE